MKYLIVLAILLTFNTFGQNSDSTEVRAVIDQLFEGMRTGDSTMVAATFHPDIQMITTFTNKEGNPASHKGSAAEFKKAVGTPHDEVWDERISEVVIQIDDNLAQVWMNYAFYLDDALSHCGVNAVQMIRTEEGWKMIHLMDTRRRKACD